MGRNKERIKSLRHQEAAWGSSFGAETAQNLPDSHLPNQLSLPSEIIYTTVTRNHDNPPELQLKNIMEQPPTPINLEDIDASLKDTADECYCSNCGPDSTCDETTANKRTIDQHFNTVRIPAKPRKF
ncbi:hypothetical protein A3A54_01065 [Candidatus Curtissbacteria bacterium RIFCSPLOWO2_01_FULL_39_62]|uniref:Uncharacterized protein n=2 Tax=Candidatus Curtissiibacteriota TaxID=1752717 RepID=A0A1F5GAL7_9BACT|nr:MAG: hypothetical protein A3D04_03765 [Candidatus Curtissbacteria bacterium RIFCSPHIGHO2_02_FULL_40_16b]OGD91041.1 MAG: hypothetical protein A3E11_00195 [Candidatus Curtissbacteria bacterium RIFCSPHIGHO2_12_FULL_38_37]OGD99375.1 MAG: hypothetical protein A3J17_02395 [Candidatus Curtissbacteria bacterium RIFCSPLOWO2_02_FULL_40_11]OGE01405.1 MAG: hypothetical protein A3A54_01065 [Candidatus Curtissbacteria bacterium RIFCSPLOWO2_01_FULL_39_62]OGE14234.1 MAG: hypothetical protein A3G14_04300 [Ca